MENDIETCYSDNSNNCEEVNFDLVTRCYQSVLRSGEPGAGKIN